MTVTYEPGRAYRSEHKGDVLHTGLSDKPWAAADWFWTDAEVGEVQPLLTRAEAEAMRDEAVREAQAGIGMAVTAAARLASEGGRSIPLETVQELLELRGQVRQRDETIAEQAKTLAEYDARVEQEIESELVIAKEVSEDAERERDEAREQTKTLARVLADVRTVCERVTDSSAVGDLADDVLDILGERSS